MSVKTVRSNLLFWKISAIFTLLLIVLGVTYIIIASQVSRKYFTDVHRQLYGGIASHLAETVHPFRNGQPDTAVTHDIIHSIMVINPGVEVYLLDTTGRIVDYTVPKTNVKMQRVNLAAVKAFIADKDRKDLTGDNPGTPGEESIFSAAPAYENGRLTGYVYAVLSSEKQREILCATGHNLYYSLGTSVFLATLLVAGIVGIIIFFLITDTICDIAGVVTRFKEGDYTARIEGNSQGNLGMLTTTFNEMADVIVSNIEKIKATDRLRQELIANVSHDLRTPLSIMQGYIETLIIKKDSFSEAERDRYLNIVMNSSVKLSQLVDQLFQFSKLEANDVQVEKEQFLLNELAADILMQYKLLAREKNINLQLESPPGLPPVFADIALTERVIQNLLDNALKFTSENGSIIIRLENTASGVKISVADTGVGIAGEDQQYIFERYRQLSNGKTTGKGMGLGLAIVKKILDLHQASIHVKSAPGEGATFWFELPVPYRAATAI